MKPQQKSISFEAALNKDADCVGRSNERIDRRANDTNMLAIFGPVLTEQQSRAFKHL